MDFYYFHRITCSNNFSCVNSNTSYFIICINSQIMEKGRMILFTARNLAKGEHREALAFWALRHMYKHLDIHGLLVVMIWQIVKIEQLVQISVGLHFVSHCFYRWVIWNGDKHRVLFIFAFSVPQKQRGIVDRVLFIEAGRSGLEFLLGDLLVTIGRSLILSLRSSTKLEKGCNLCQWEEFLYWSVNLYANTFLGTEYMSIHTCLLI